VRRIWYIIEHYEQDWSKNGNHDQGQKDAWDCMYCIGSKPTDWLPLARCHVHMCIGSTRLEIFDSAGRLGNSGFHAGSLHGECICIYQSFAPCESHTDPSLVILRCRYTNVPGNTSDCYPDDNGLRLVVIIAQPAYALPKRWGVRRVRTFSTSVCRYCR
jgi:hypothetical protein